MAKLLDQTNVGGRVEKTWLHTGEDGRDKITVEHQQNVDPVMDYTKHLAQNQKRSDFATYKATISFTHIDDMSKQCAKHWGVTVKDAFQEIMGGRTNRAQAALKVLTEGRDFRKLQAQYY